MSVYRNLYLDFPLRVEEVWRDYRRPAARRHRDVTLLLMAATAGMAAPFEHVREQKKDAEPAHHPSHKPGDAEKYKEARAWLRMQLDASFVATGGTLRCKGSAQQSERPMLEDVRYGYEEQLRYVGREAKHAQPLAKVENGKGFSNRDVVTWLRNALAHHSVYAFGEGKRLDGEAEITRLAFFTQHRGQLPGEVKGYRILTFSVGEFETLLENWFALLKACKSHVRAQEVRSLLTDDFAEFALAA